MAPPRPKGYRRRFVHKKRHKVAASASVASQESVADNQSPSCDDHGPYMDDEPIIENSNKNSEEQCQSDDGRSSVLEHDYCTASSSSGGQEQLPRPSQSSFQPYQSSMSECRLKEVLNEIKTKMEPFLHSRLCAVVRDSAVHVLFMSPQESVIVQRSIVFKPSGTISVYIHAKPVDSAVFMKSIDPSIPLDDDSFVINYFVDRSIQIVNQVRLWEICSGCDDPTFRDVWEACPFGEIDKNVFKECRYVETFRSISCEMLVSNRKWRCSECSKGLRPLRRRLNLSKKDPHRNTPNMFLTERQKLQKLKDLKREKDCQYKKLMRVRNRMQEMLKKEGVTMDVDMATSLQDILDSSDMTPAQRIFMQQQVKASQLKNMKGMRWHPTMVRLALSIHLTSPAAYNLMRDSGIIKLPSSRTLFDYAHAKPLEDGINRSVIESLHKKVDKLPVSKKYHVLMMDEMHVSQNLVFQKSSGKLIGYANLDKVDEEVRNFEKNLDNFQSDEEVEYEDVIITKALVYMVKGIAVRTKEVVACYGVHSPSVEQMTTWTWQVIGALERSGIRVIAVVSDGYSVNRAFYRRHKPRTTTESGVVFDTVNRAARDRPIFFISDVPHLLKTIRNCLLSSRSDRKKGKRNMRRKGQKISWDFILRLFNEKKGKTLRKSFKLNAMNVYPDSYSRMKVKYAAEVLSNTVAQDLEDQQWPGTAEMVKFLRRWNRWFDCLNGAHSSMGKKRRNADLNAYTDESDERFDFLEWVLQDLTTWKEEAYSSNPNNTTVDADAGNANLEDESDIFEGEDVSDIPGSRQILSRETLEGIEMSTRAIIGAIKFLLGEGVSFINARVFTQDPLEQHFSKLRAGQGGSSNPNYAQVLNRNNALHTIGEMGMRLKRGNVPDSAEWVEVTSEPLPKRKCKRIRKFS